MRSTLKLLAILALASLALMGSAMALLISNNLSGSIAVTNTFQSIQVSSIDRKGCTVQNPAANANHQWVYFGPIANATKATAFELTPGATVNCATRSGGVLIDQVSITGTAADLFVANFQ